MEVVQIIMYKSLVRRMRQTCVPLTELATTCLLSALVKPEPFFSVFYHQFIKMVKIFAKNNLILNSFFGFHNYEGISIPRAAPSPRAVSLGVVVNESLPNYDVTLMTMQFGQFLDHDITLTPTATLRKT